jgi:undecaprenyl-diphosphatase
VFLVFQAWSFATKVQANWAAHAYLPAAIALAGWSAASPPGGLRPRTTRRLNRLLLVSIILPAVLAPVALFPETLAIFGAGVPATVDLVSKRLRGWRELGQAVGEQMRRMPRPPFLVSDRYQIASELAFYVPGNPRVFNANFGRRMNQYDLWGGWGDLQGRDALFVTYGEGEAPPALRQAFDQVERLRVVSIEHRGVHLRDFSIFWGRQFRGFPPRPFEGF